jgi:hypothetical protein
MLKSIWSALFDKLEADQKKRFQAESVISDPHSVQPRTEITVHGSTKLRYSIEATDKDDALQLNGKEIRNSMLNQNLVDVSS